MRDRLVELLCNVKCEGEECFGNCPHRIGQKCNKVQRLEMCSVFAIADHLLSEGVIVPPLSIGQKVYINAFRNDIQSFTVTNIYVQRDRDNRTYFAYDAEIGEGNEIYFDEEKIGNIIFLNQEEAEKALAERSGE